MSPVNIISEIITIGDEILYGQILDSNAQWMSSALDDIGVKVKYRTTIGDNEPDILDALQRAEGRADVVLITGGLGPTSDDLTKPCLAKYFNAEIVENELAMKELAALFKHIGRDLTETNRAQAYLPENCTHVPNKMGTAPGMWFFENQTVFVSMPGVPFEMKEMMTQTVLPKIQEAFHTPFVVHKMVKTIGIGESWLADKIKPWADQLPEDIKLAYLPSLGHVKLRLTTQGNDLEKLESNLNNQVERLQPYADKYIYGYDSDTIESVIGKHLKDQNLTIATAESCTGGYLAHMLTSVPGSSAYFKGGILAYANEVKIAQLEVKAETLEAKGAVSEQTVIEMAEGACQKLGTDIAIATSGIAGPDGGTEEKPVGTIWIAVKTPETISTRKLSLYKDRLLNIKSTSVAALALAWQTLNQSH